MKKSDIRRLHLPENFCVSQLIFLENKKLESLHKMYFSIFSDFVSHLTSNRPRCFLENLKLHGNKFKRNFLKDYCEFRIDLLLN